MQYQFYLCFVCCFSWRKATTNCYRLLKLLFVSMTPVHACVRGWDFQEKSFNVLALLVHHIKNCLESNDVLSVLTFLFSLEWRLFLNRFLLSFVWNKVTKWFSQGFFQIIVSGPLVSHFLVRCNKFLKCEFCMYHHERKKLEEKKKKKSFKKNTLKKAHFFIAKVREKHCTPVECAFQNLSHPLAMSLW